MRVRHLARATEEAFIHWMRRYLRFHASPMQDGRRQWKHPTELGDEHVRAFLTDLAVNGNVSASTQNQPLAALLFLHNHVLEKPLGMIDALRAQHPRRVPIVLSRREVLAVLEAMSGMHRLMAE